MIDWLAIVFHSFWLIGAAALLAGFSYHHWLAAQENRPVGQQLNQLSFRTIAWFALLMIGIGLAGTSQTYWETILWIVIGIFCLYQLFQVLQSRP